MQPVVHLHNVSKTFNPSTPAEVKAIREVTLDLNPGEVVLIMGPSGSGKTTLLTMIGGLLKATAGEIIVQGQDVSRLNQAALTKLRRQRIGFIFQSFNLLQNLTSFENVLVAGFDQANKQRATKLLDQLGLAKRSHARPSDLSGGERQRVAIARALINNPQLILADEPTANLDSKVGHEVMQLLCEIACQQRKAVIIVSHDERLKDVAKRVITIEDGRLTKEERGGHDQNCDHSLASGNKRD